MPHYILTDSKDLVVVVTGCDSGFGAEILNDLYQRGGSTIYATCLTFQAVESTRPRRLPTFEISKSMLPNKTISVASVARLKPSVLKASIVFSTTPVSFVFFLFLTTGINIGGHFDLTTKDAFERMMDVNYMGIIRVTKALLPSLRAYANVSKHAAELILDTLRVELSPWEIDVSMIEPFFAKTPIMTNSFTAFDQNWKRADIHVHAMDGPAFAESACKRNQFLCEKAMPPQ
ncbi:Retinol dehydrogenase 16 [Mortierella sp. GBA39]|nr:Retinol dehydrogenase 16 [Mortierella sp. GBA39]